MSALRVHISIGDIERSQWREMRVDVVASQPLSFVPVSVLRELGVLPAMTGSIQFPDGDRRESELGYAWLRLDEREAMTHFVFADESIPPCLGRIAINSLLLEYDADNQILRPMTKFTL